MSAMKSTCLAWTICKQLLLSRAVIKFFSSRSKIRFTRNISQKIYSASFSFLLWSPVTSSEFSRNRCYGLRPLMTALLRMIVQACCGLRLECARLLDKLEQEGGGVVVHWNHENFLLCSYLDSPITNCTCWCSCGILMKVQVPEYKCSMS